MDAIIQSDDDWLLSVQQKLYRWSSQHPEDCYKDLWNWVTDARNLRCAWRRARSNRGARTAGIDGETFPRIEATVGSEALLQEIRDAMRTGKYRPCPCRRKLIPKRGKPGQFRPLGIPTVRDRVVQGAIKNVIEPIFEATFWHVSYGFRPGRSCHGALEHLRMTIRPRAKSQDGRRRQAPYQWVIEGDIKGCFDHINHHHLMQRIRARISDLKVTRLIGRFLKAGVLESTIVSATNEGTPQGGIISPLLANIALTPIEERYERWVHHRKKTTARRACDGITAALRCRSTDRKRGVPVFFPIRYADDFVILVAGTREQAEAEKAALVEYLKLHTGLELSADKSRITDLKQGFEFLGHLVRLKWHSSYGLMPRIEIPKHKQSALRTRVKFETRRDSIGQTLTERLRRLNSIVRGWGRYYRHCTGASKIFNSIDHYVGNRLWRWQLAKHKGLRRQRSSIRGVKSLLRPTRTVWREGLTEQFLLATLPVQRFQRGWMRTPGYASDLK